MDSDNEQGYGTGYSPSSHADDLGHTGVHATMAKQVGLETQAVASVVMPPFSVTSGLTWDVASTTSHSPLGTPGGLPTGLASQAVARALTSETPGGSLPG